MTRKSRNIQTIGRNFWRGTCRRCGTDITRRTSLAVLGLIVTKDGRKVAQYGPERECRDKQACRQRQADKKRIQAGADFLTGKVGSHRTELEND